jgi:hypothetical protein
MIDIAFPIQQQQQQQQKNYLVTFRLVSFHIRIDSVNSSIFHNDYQLHQCSNNFKLPFGRYDKEKENQDDQCQNDLFRVVTARVFPQL